MSQPNCCFHTEFLRFSFESYFLLVLTAKKQKKQKKIQLTVNKLYITLSGLQLITVELLSGFAVTYSFHNDNLLNP